MGMFVTIKWKNITKWKTEFSGDITDFMNQKGITVIDVVHPQNKDLHGFSIYIPLGNSKILYTTYGTDENKARLKAVQHLLTELGDEAKIISTYGTYNIN